jgi:chromosomal replication initiation ATPase DnaA
MTNSYQNEIQRILDKHKMTWKVAMGPGMTMPFIRVRAEIYIMLRNRPKPWSYPKIAKLCGGRDHTTIMHSIRRYESKQNRAA